MNHKGKGAVTLSTSLPALPDKGTHTQVPKTAVKDGTRGHSLKKKKKKKKKS